MTLPAILRDRPIEDLLGMSRTELDGSAFSDPVEAPTHETIEDVTYVSLPRHGVSLVLTGHEFVDAVQLYASGHDGYEGYAAKLPGGLSFDMSLMGVRRRLGYPQRHEAPSIIPTFGMHPAWDSFDMRLFRLHVEYTPDEQAIQLVTLMPPLMHPSTKH